MATETVESYLEGLPEDRREAIEAIRKVILKNLDKGFSEGIQYRMIGYYVPHELYPAGYHCDPKQPLPYASLASQKSHMALYLMSVYMSPELDKWFREAWAKSGKKLDMGKSCIRFKKLEDVPLDVVGEVFRRLTAKDYIARYEALLGMQAGRSKGRPAAKGPGAKSSGAKKSAAKQSSGKKVAKKAATKKAAKKAARRG